MVRCHLKQSKTDQLGRGVDVVLGRTGLELCPVAAVLSYIVRRGSQPGPFFLTTAGVPLVKQEFVSEFRKILAAVGLPQRTMQATVSALGQPLQRPWRGWRIPPFNSWVGGRVLPSYDILGLPTNGWRQCPVRWQPKATSQPNRQQRDRLGRLEADTVRASLESSLVPLCVVWYGLYVNQRYSKEDVMAAQINK